MSANGGGEFAGLDAEDIRSYLIPGYDPRRGPAALKNQAFRMAPQSGHVSNFGGLKRGPLEPLQLL